MTTADDHIRPLPQRLRDVRERLSHECDVWAATADPDGEPHLVPLSFSWDGTSLWLATRITNPTGRNLAATGRVRLSLDGTRDVVVLDGDAETVPVDAAPAAAAEGYAAQAGWDPRLLGHPTSYFRIALRSVQTWRNEAEHPGRWVLRNGRWADETA